MKLRQQVLQDVISLRDKDWAMDVLQAFLEELKEREKDGRIPGLPYTEEERKADLIQAEQEIAEGKVIAWEDVKRIVCSYLGLDPDILEQKVNGTYNTLS